jgi:hypothetical protein
MKRTCLIILLIIVNIVAIGAFMIWFCNRSYPMIGQDNRLFMPYMLDSFLHQKINGLTIQWYTPSFAGGRPVYTNPQDFQFSLPQFLMWIANPWMAILSSMLVFIIVGFIGTYYFLRKLLGLNPFASILGAVFFIANGFYFNHMAVGHLTFQAFTLFPVIMVIIVHPRIPSWLAGLLLSFTCAILFYSGVHDISFFLLTGIIFFPLLYLIKPSLWNSKRFIAVALWGGILTILLCGSKLWAVYSFMHFFPRLAQDNYTTNLWTGMVGIVHQLLGTMTLAPLYRVLQGKFTFDSIVALSKSTGTIYGYWELDESLSPALLLLLAGGLIKFLAHKPDIKAPLVIKRLIAGICLILAIWLVIEFTLAKGVIYPLLRSLPIIKSQQVNIRNTCAFIFPLAVVGANIFHHWIRNWRPKTMLAVFLVFDVFALASLLSYRYITNIYLVGERKYEYMQCDVQPILDTYIKIRYQGETFPVEKIIPDADPWSVFQENATNLIDPYNTFFKGITAQLTTLHAGSVYDIENGYFNIVNPTGYVFPEVNHSKMYERISVTEKAQFINFINRRDPSWKLPVIQQVLNWTALITLIAEFGAILAWLARKRIRFPKYQFIT